MRIKVDSRDVLVKAVSEAKRLKVEKRGKKKEGVDAPNTLPISAKDLGVKIKKLQQEIKRIEKGNLPEAEKERLLKQKKAELGRLSQQMAQQKKGAKVRLDSLPQNARKKKASAIAPQADMKKKLTALKEKLKQAEKDMPGAMESIRELKGKIRLIEAKMKGEKGVVKV